jgi:hypothetical protein
MSGIFTRYRRSFKKECMTRKRIIYFVNNGTKMIFKDHISDSLYSSELTLEISRSVTKNEQRLVMGTAFNKKNL